MKTTKKLAALLGAGALTFAMFGTAIAADPDYATVSGHESGSEDANHEDYWGDNCTKLDAGEGDLGSEVDSYVLTADYAKVIVKAGSGDNANTIFDNPTSGQTVWADTNGNNTFDPGGPDGDKNISHIIFCDESQESEEPSFEQSEGAETDEPSEPSTDAFGGTGTSGPADGAWLLVVALGVLLASIVVMTPARAKSRR